MATPLQDQQTAYANISAQLAEMTANPKPSYSSDGKSVSWGEHFMNLTRALEALGKIKGVAPEQNAIITVISVGR